MTQQFEVMSSGYGFSSFGAENTTFKALDCIDSERFRLIDYRRSYYECTQHDWKRYDWQGHMIAPGPPTTQPLLSSEAAPYNVPYKYRRPIDPYRLGRVIVNRFTNMIFGEGRWPNINVEGDENAQDFVQALIKAQNLPAKMTEARTVGGSSGAVALSWCFHNGLPKTEVHSVKNMVVQEWQDREELIPKVVTEVYKYFRDSWNFDKRNLERQWFWFRRDWTPEADIVFKEVPYEYNKEPVFEIDIDKSVVHNDGFCHVIWIQNIPSADPDSEPDYEGVYDNLDNLDILSSVTSKGTISNIDPTLLMKIDLDEIDFRTTGIKKGSDNAITLKKDEDASYLELGGSSLTAANTIFEAKRKQLLEVVECVIIDSDTVAAQGTSSVAMKMIYSPMLGRCDTFRTQYGNGIKRLLNNQLEVARRAYSEGKVLNLPPCYKMLPVIDSAGFATGEESLQPVARHPGESGEIEIVWGAYFKPTPDDQSKTTSVLVQANGGKPIISSETATALASASFGIDAHEEQKRLQRQQEQEKKDRDFSLTDLMDEAGGKVG